MKYIKIMVLIDALYVNNGGGKILLDYLIDYLENTDLNIFYLFDDRIKNKYSIKPNNKSIYLKSSLTNRNKFYKGNRNTFKKVFVLGNIPPPIKLYDCKVFTLFHNAIYLNVPKEFSITEKIKYFLKIKILKFLSKNNDCWIVQSNYIKMELNSKFGFKNILTLPFFNTLNKNSELIFQNKKEKNSLLYVSNAQPNKNHLRLIHGFCKTYDKLKKGVLYLTVNNDFPEVSKEIEIAQIKGYPIINLGFVDQNELIKLYSNSEYIIYPSLSESFGLGIIEGIEFNCKIIGADLPYTYAICEPSFTFNPFEINEISNAIEYVINNDVKKSKLLVKSEINKLINLLSENV